MPRDNDKDNNSRGRRDRPSGGKGRSGAARGPEKKFAKRGFGKSEGGNRDGQRRPYAGKPEGARSYGKKPYAGKRDGDAPRPRGDRGFGDRPPRKDFRAHDDRGGEKRPYTPRGERGDASPAGRFSERKFGGKKTY